MSIHKGIAQSNTYAGAFKMLILQFMLLALLIGLLSNSWWWATAVPIIAISLGLSSWLRLTVVIVLSSLWAALVFKITLEAGGSQILAGSLSVFFAFLAYGINASGMIGLMHATPDFTNHGVG